MSNLRDYGLGETTHLVRGAPKVTGPVEDGVCPHCHCETVYSITVDVAKPNDESTLGVGRYVGCPACPWASPMVMAFRHAA